MDAGKDGLCVSDEGGTLAALLQDPIGRLFEIGSLVLFSFFSMF